MDINSNYQGIKISLWNSTYDDAPVILFTLDLNTSTFYYLKISWETQTDRKKSLKVEN